MSRLELRFLGTPEIWREQQQLKFPTRKSLALVVYLAVAGGWHSRETLMALLWPESSPQRSRASLRNALARLRHALSEAEDHLLVEGELLAFDLTTAVILDVHRLAVAAQAQESIPLQEAVELYRGDFLEGFTLPDALAFDEWASVQREYWHRQMSEILARLAQLQTDQGQVKKGLDTVRRWTAHDPLNEVAHRRLMELYARLGDKTAALQAYERCRAILVAELGLEPSPETHALAERIRSTKGERMKDEDRRYPSSLTHLPFVGRSIKHLQLVTAFHAAKQEQAQVVIIEGEAGIGKTRLATEFLSWATDQGADVLRGRAFEAGGRLPYQPLIEALRRRVEQENAPEDLLSDVWLAELSRLLPELRDRYPDLPLPTADENEARSHLLEAVARLGQALAERQGPVVIFIDDLHWADVASLDLLHYCGHAWAEAGLPVLLLLVRRREATAADSALDEWLANLGRDISSHQLALESLTLDDTRQLARSLLGREDAAGLSVAHRFGAWLFAQTGGQPFFVTETIKELVNRGVLQARLRQAGPWKIDLAALETWLAARSSLTPMGVRQLITARLNRLRPAASALLTAAAVLGRDCSYTLLGQVADLDEVTGLSGLDELLKAHLLSETDNADRPYTIAHDKIREVVYDGAGAARRRLFHRRVLEALEKAAAAHPELGRRAAELAYHALGAHLTEPAFRYSQAAGDEALRLFAIHDAITHYEQARSLITNHHLPTSNFHLQLGRAYELAGELKQAEGVYQELLQQAQTANQVDLTCTALNRLATVAVHAYDFATAVGYLQQALRLAEEYNHKPGRAEAEWNLAQLYHHRFDFKQSLIRSRRTLELARELGDEALAAGSVNSLAYAQMLLGQVSVGEATMIEARDRYARLGNKALEADCLTAIAAAQIWQGRIQDGIETARAAEAICAAIDNPWGHIYSRVWLATGLLDRGEYEAALAVAQAGQNQARLYNLPPMGIFIALVLGRIYRTLGQVVAAYETHQAAFALNEQVKSDVHVAFISAELCADCVLAGNWAEATTHARQALAYRKYDVLPLVISARWLETEALLRGGEVELARTDVRRWGKLVGSIPRLRVGHLRSLAILAGWEGDAERAIDHLQAAFTLAEQIGLPGEEWQILAKRGELYKASGDEEKRRQALAQATKIIQVLATKIDDENLKHGFCRNWIDEIRVQSGRVKLPRV
ncbi:MAG: AAA family ATPase [Ardenticatenaceae bacterium]|nr:AAA family ATPase [Ardenticatenaceae bacterium]